MLLYTNGLVYIEGSKYSPHQTVWGLGCCILNKEANCNHSLDTDIRILA